MHEHEYDRESQPGCGEVAGETAANCAAVCCCCPLALLDIVLLVTVKLPAGVMRRVRRRRGRRRAAPRAPSPSGSGKPMIASATAAAVVKMEEVVGPRGGGPEALELEKEIMSSRFYGAGFWRSISQRSSGSCSGASSRR